MVQGVYEDGDPYEVNERPRFPVRRWVWGTAGLVGAVVAAYLLFPPRWEDTPVLEQITTLNIPTPVWNGYNAVPEPARAEAAVPPRDSRYEALQEELAALRRELAQKQALPAQAPAPGQAPKPQPHRPMGYMAFAQPEAKQETEPLYTLAPGDTVVPCVVLTKINSDVESIATVKTTTNIYDTESRRRILVPQGSTILMKYQSAGLLYGNKRLPMTSTLLTLPNGRVVELDGEPLLDGEGQAGLVTRVNSHFWRAVPAIVISGVLRGSQQVVTTTNPIAGGVAGSAAQYGQRTVQPYLDARPTIEIDPGESCNAILTRAIQLPEYRERG